MAYHLFTESEIAAIYRVIAERRDMRHFAHGSIAPETLTKLSMLRIKHLV
jgi:5,6-dimethylbenzimidazole synthase